MKSKIIALSALSLLFLLADCSKTSSPSAVIDDTLIPVALTTRVITIDTLSPVRFEFKQVTLPDGKRLWVSTTEITQQQYEKIMDSICLTPAYPVSVSWYNAALFANKMTLRANALPLHTPVAALDTIYYSGPEKVFHPLRNRISGFICLSTDSLKGPVDSLVYQHLIDSAIILTHRVGRLTLAQADTAARKAALYAALLSLEPDSLHLGDSSLAVYPHKAARTGLMKALDSLGQSGVTLTAFRHAYRFENDTTYNVPSIPHFSDPALYTAIDTTVQLLDSVLALDWWQIYFFKVPTDSVLINAFKHIYAFPSPDTAKDHPWTYYARVWTNDSLTKKGFRLPTADEWESIAMCGSNIPYSTYNGKLNPQGAVYGQASASPVASLKANPWGFFDLTGNLYEWTNDWWDDNGAYTINISPDSSQPPLKTAKGGCFRNAESSNLLSISANYSSLPDSTGRGSIGFRLVAPDGDFWKDSSLIP